MSTKTGDQKLKDSDKVGKEPESTQEEMVSVTFKENRKYDLHIGRKVITFMARETLEIPKRFLEHDDWKQAAKRFVVNNKKVKSEKESSDNKDSQDK